MVLVVVKVSFLSLSLREESVTLMREWSPLEYTSIEKGAGASKGSLPQPDASMIRCQPLRYFKRG